MRRCVLRCAGVRRELTPTTLLDTVRSDPGMTAAYYANRYFGSDQVMRVNHVLWTDLKRYGKVTCSRAEDASDATEQAKNAAPRWFVVFAEQRVHHVRRHNPDEEDLSVLHNTSPPQQQQQPRGADSIDDDDKDRYATPLATALYGAAAATAATRTEGIAHHDALYSGAAATAVADGRNSSDNSSSTTANAISTPVSVSSLDVDKAVLYAVQSVPGQSIQFYVHELPFAMQSHAPAAFRRLREAGLLTREATSEGTFIWH